MSVEIHIVDGALPASPTGSCSPAFGAGAVLVFEGIVRPTEEGRQLAALEYEAYEPMASQQLTALAKDVLRVHGLISLQCVHSRGRVPVGACSLRITIASPHRKEGLDAMDEFIDRLKRDVPIWKKVVWVD